MPSHLEVRLEGAEFEVKRRRELEGAMRRAAGLEPSLASPLAAPVVALLKRLKGSRMKIFDLRPGTGCPT